MSRKWADMVWEDYIDILLRQRWYIIIPLGLSFAISVALAIVLPRTYLSTTVIMVEQQKVPEAYVKSSVTANINQRLSTIKQQIMSRSLLIGVIEEFDLYSELDPAPSPEQKAELMGNQIMVDVDKGRSSIDAFSISFEGTDPEITRQVTDRLTERFIQENLRVREEFIEGTSDFLDKELEEVKAALIVQEDRIRKFKQKYIGELPEQTGANLRTLDRLQLEYQAVLNSTTDLKTRLAELLEKGPRAANIG